MHLREALSEDPKNEGARKMFEALWKGSLVIGRTRIGNLRAERCHAILNFRNCFGRLGGQVFVNIRRYQDVIRYECRCPKASLTVSSLVGAVNTSSMVMAMPGTIVLGPSRQNTFLRHEHQINPVTGAMHEVFRERYHGQGRAQHFFKNFQNT